MNKKEKEITPEAEVILESQEVVEVKNDDFFSNPESVRKKFRSFTWKVNKDGNPSFVKMEDMETSHLIKAVLFSEKKAKEYADKMDLFMCKYEELLYVLKQRDISEDEVMTLAKKLKEKSV